ncbi:WD40 repeat-like protein [Mytilinidion resinicola]|uniref:WD40 repeat-like protein n=1 Tax=Mytilinidion resinicola TaxID=574789 RepID=A0A6A6Y306_9PEZI|nr:WD40 repeat-like protein [Mytilinidion resinicola]KAF2802908.1 WD40 repeat-like protein [Mytilinidion resinicola]
MSGSHSSSTGNNFTNEREDPRVAVYDPHAADWEDDEEDDDMNYVYAPQGSDDEDDEDGDYHDAPEDLSGVEIEFEMTETDEQEGEVDDDEEEEEENEDRAPAVVTGLPRPITITQEQLMRLLGHAGLTRLLARGHPSRLRHFSGIEDEDDDSEPDTGYGGVNPRARRGRGRKAFQKVPSDEGRALMESGNFGSNTRREDTITRKKKLQYRIMRRELGLGSTGRQSNSNHQMSQGLIPSSKADIIINYNARCYSGQFSNDGNFFFSCAQDFRTVVYPYGQWTITDASLSPDNQFLAYSSIRSVVCLAATDPNQESEPTLLDFAHLGTRQRGGWRAQGFFGIWSIRFSGDGREIVAGTGDSSVYVYDIERQQSILRIPGHSEDVNAVCFGDSQSPHILYSGSDDTTLKVWDRRSMGDGREAGVFLGHTEGLTYVDSKGDGRYVLSNAKDQTAKLWDLRKMLSKEKADQIDPGAYTTNFEYRTNAYDDNDYRPHPHDCSLVTFRGHKVLKTLIRCHFSPPGSTDSRYVYSGSYDGSVYIWNLDATLAGKVDVLTATRNSRPRDPSVLVETYDFIGRNGGAWQTCVRDASWHPDAPVIAATSWNGWGISNGTCTVHSWNDGVDEDEAEPRMGKRVNAQLEHDDRLYAAPTYRSTRARRTVIINDDDDDDDDPDWFGE